MGSILFGCILCSHLFSISTLHFPLLLTTFFGSWIVTAASLVEGHGKKWVDVITILFTFDVLASLSLSRSSNCCYFEREQRRTCISSLLCTHTKRYEKQPAPPKLLFSFFSFFVTSLCLSSWHPPLPCEPHSQAQRHPVKQTPPFPSLLFRQQERKRSRAWVWVFLPASYPYVFAPSFFLCLPVISKYPQARWHV